MDWENYAREYDRKHRREAILLSVFGVGTVLAGVFLCVISSPWLGATAIAFGVACLTTGIGMLGPEGSHAGTLWMIVGCISFAVMCALMIATSLADPGAFGWRPASVGLVVGVLGLAFFGPGAVILMVREVKRRKSASSL